MIEAVAMISIASGLLPCTVRRRIESGTIPLTLHKTNKRIVHVDKWHAKQIADEMRKGPKGPSIADLKSERDEWKKCATSLANARTPFEKINARAMFDRLCSQNSPPTAPARSAAGPTPRTSVDRDEQRMGQPLFHVRPLQIQVGSSSERGFTSAQKTAERGASSSPTGQPEGTKGSSICSSETTRQQSGSED